MPERRRAHHLPDDENHGPPRAEARPVRRRAAVRLPAQRRGGPDVEPGQELNPRRDHRRPVTYLLIDGENLDATLGVDVLGHRPAPEDRPRWERVLDFVQVTWGRPVKALFFINASSGDLPMPFLQALVAMGFRPVLLSGPHGVKVVDVGIQRTLEAIAVRDRDVMLGSHDADFLPQIEVLLGDDRSVGLLAFREFVNARYADLAASGLQIFDLEDDAKSFNRVLPRLRVIDIDSFDPAASL